MAESRVQMVEFEVREVGTHSRRSLKNAKESIQTIIGLEFQVFCRPRYPLIPLGIEYKPSVAYFDRT